MEIKLKLFLETSAFNFYHYGKAGEKQRETIKLFNAIESGKYDAYTSDSVLEEINHAVDKRRSELLIIVEKYTKKIFSANDDARKLAKLYVVNDIIPVDYFDDALHIATATVNNFDFVISYNMGHIIKAKTMIGTGIANLRSGYKQIGLSTPKEMNEYDP
ncbi:MAG: hypothetical protein LBU17_10610 [Treponema sp.]|jgi:predicted nucleic acid-binding protein|nr:hypothetical protein [Treponema sp.]